MQRSQSTERLAAVLASALGIMACQTGPAPAPQNQGGAGPGSGGRGGGAGGQGGTAVGTGGTARAGGSATGGAGPASDATDTAVASVDAAVDLSDLPPDAPEEVAPIDASASDAMILPATMGAPEPIGAGWTEIFPSYKVDQPPGQMRYTLTGNEFHFWLFNNDASTFPGRDSGPRSEVHIRNNYTTGQAQYQADIKIDANCTGVSTMQIFGGSQTATGFMAWVIGNDLHHYGAEVIASNIKGRYFRLNVLHDTGSGNVDVYIDGQKRASYQDHGRGTHYFKCGIYHQRNMAARCDAYYKNIRVFKK